MDQIKVGAFLKDLRKEKEITQEQLAEELGVSGRTISRWETGKNMPDISLLVEIAEFFDVSIPERNMSIIGLIALIVYMTLRETGIYDRNDLFRYAYVISEALIYVTVLMFPLYTTGVLGKFRINKSNSKFDSIPWPVIKVIGFAAAFAIAAMISILISKMIG